MRKSLIWAASAMMAIGLLTGCGSSKSAETTAEASVAESSSEESTSAEAESSSEEAESSEAEVSADNPFNGKTVKVGCSATFVPFESIEMAADGSKTYVGMNIDIVKSPPFKSAINPHSDCIAALITPLMSEILACIFVYSLIPNASITTSGLSTVADA